MAIKINPLGRRVVIKPLETETKTSSGIYIPNTMKEEPNTGEVVAVSNSKKLVVKLGDNVLFLRHAGTKVELDGQEYIILEDKEILAII